MARRTRDPRTGTPEPVTWRDGVHLTGTPVWCDARRARDVCFASSVERVGRAGHGQLIATAATLAQLGPGDGHLGVPYRRPFTLGTVRLELLPSGHALGAAALAVDVNDRRILYCGPVAPAGGGLGGAAEWRPSEVLVVGAPYGRAGHRFPAADDAATALIDWCRDVIAGPNPGVAVVLVTSTGKGLDVATRLGATGLDVGAHRSIHQTVQRLRDAGLDAPTVRRPSAIGGRVLIWPVRERGRLDAALAGARRRVALVSGLAVEPGAVAGAGADHGVAWSNAADRDALHAFITATGARRIYVTGRCADDVVADLGDRGRALGPPRQMALFAAALALP